jgi:hypothetical protein
VGNSFLERAGKALPTVELRAPFGQICPNSTSFLILRLVLSFETQIFA